MIDAIQSLLRLQETDLQLHDANTEAASFGPERASEAARLGECESAVQAAKAAVADIEQRHRGLEAELQQIDALVTKLDAQLYELTSKHALETLQGEQARAGAQRSDKEDSILEVLDELDTATGALSAARESVRDAEATSAAAEAVRVKREPELAEQIARLDAGRTKLAEGVKTPVLRSYDGARRKRLPAVVFVSEKSCPVCRMVLSPQKLIELGAVSALVQCGSCDRVLYGEKVAQAERDLGATG